MTLPKAYLSALESYVPLGLYGEQLGMLRRAGFTLELAGGIRRSPAADGRRLLVIVSERFLANQRTAWRAVWSFLGVNVTFDPLEQHARVNRAYAAPATMASNASLQQLYRAYYDSIESTYLHLGERIAEWEAYHARLRTPLWSDGNLWSWCNSSEELQARPWDRKPHHPAAAGLDASVNNTVQ